MAGKITSRSGGSRVPGPPHFIKRDCACVGHVETVHRGIDRYPCRCFATLTHKPPDSASFAAEHEQDIAGRPGVSDARFAIAGDGDAPETVLAEFVQGARNIDHLDIGHDVERTRRRLGKRA